MFCTACGTKNSQESNFCKQCGHALEKPTAVKISEADFDRALPDEEQVSALLERAYRLRKEGDLAGAIALCEEALHLPTESTSAHSLLGQLYEQRGEHEKAIREYERVLALNPGSIADRVKLDELRSRNSPPITRPPHIVLSSGKSFGKSESTSVPNFLAMAGVALLLMCAGGGLALMMRSNTSSGSPAVQNGTLASHLVPNSPAQSESFRADSPNTNLPSRELASNSGGQPFDSGSGFWNPNNGFTGLQANNGMRPVQEPMSGAQPRRPTFSQPPVDNPRITPVSASSGSLPNLNNIKPPNRTTASAPAAASTEGSRVRLPSSEDGVVDEGKGRYQIKFNLTPDKSKPPTNTKPDPKTPDGGSIRIDMGNGANTPQNNAASAEAHSFVSMGDDLKLKGDYKRAVEVYHKALPSAGDSTGFVLQSIARCHQDRGDRVSAVTNYEKAVVELQKLVSAGRNADAARAAIKACESGIKVCRSE